MKKIMTILLALFAIQFSFGANYSGTFSEEEERKVSSFSGINLGISADVFLTQENSQKVVLEGDSDVLEKIETEVSGNTLVIKYEKSFRIRNIPKVKIYISVPEIEKLSVSGSGSILAQNSINSEDIEFNVSGSGLIEIDDLTVDNISSSISGSGDIVLSGSETVKFFKISISGSGDLSSEGLKVDEFIARISGSGKCKTNVVSRLEAVISGSGRIYYKGNPIIDASISGSGKIENF